MGMDDAGHHSSPKRSPQRSRKVAEMREESVTARDRRIREFPLSMSPRAIAEMAQGPRALVRRIKMIWTRLPLPRTCMSQPLTHLSVAAFSVTLHVCRS